MEGQSFYPTAVDIRLWLRDRHTGDLTDFCWQPDGPVAGMLQSAAAEYAGKVASSAQGVAVLQFAGPQEALSAAKSLQEKLSASQEEKDGNVTAALFVSPWLDAGSSTEEQAAELRRTLDTLEPGHIAMSDEIYQIAKAMPFFESATEKVSSSGNGVSASIHELEFTTEVIPSAAEEASAPVQESAPTESNTAPATGATPEISERPTSPGAAHHARYEIISKLGSGAMGVVYKAHDRMIGRTVALKTIRVDSQDMDRGELVQRLLQEAKAAGGLDHPNIITVYDVGEADNVVYMSMQFIEGDTLSSVLAGKRLLPLPTLLSYADQICDAIGFAHQRAIIHRDLKPSNLMVTPTGSVKVLDFGIAKLGDSGLTQKGMVIGTPDYMSPEQGAGRRVDHRSDIFTLGAVFYELFTGEKAFSGQSITAILYKVMHEDPVPPWVVEPSLPRALGAIIQRALAKDPQQRFQSCEEMREAFRQQGLLLGASYGASTGLAPASATANMPPAVPAEGNKIAGPSDANPSLDNAPDYSPTPQVDGAGATDPFMAHKPWTLAGLGGIASVTVVLLIILGILLLHKKPDGTTHPASSEPASRSTVLPSTKVERTNAPPVSSQAPVSSQVLEPAKKAIAEPTKKAVAESIKKSGSVHRDQPLQANDSPKTTQSAGTPNNPPTTPSEPSIGFTKSDIPGMLKKADAAYGQGDYASSINDYNLILRVDPQNSDALAGKNRALEAMKDAARH